MPARACPTAVQAPRARPCAGYPRLQYIRLWQAKTWVAGTSPATGFNVVSASVGGAGRLPGDHLPLAGLVDPDIGKADAEIHRVAAGIDADARVAGEDDRVAQILRLDIRGHDRGVDRAAAFHRADQALFRVEPRRRMRVDEIVRDQLVQRRDVFLRHRAHALAVEIDDLLSITGHVFPPVGGLEQRSAGVSTSQFASRETKVSRPDH